MFKTLNVKIESDPTSPNGGVLILGATNPAYYLGPISYVNLISNPGYWQFSMKR